MANSTQACSAVGINFESPSQLLDSLCQLDQDVVTNGLMLEIFEYVQKQKKKHTVRVTWKDMRDALGVIFQQNMEDVSPATIHTSVSRVKQQRVFLLTVKAGARGSRLEDYLASKFSLPLSGQKNSRKRTAAAEGYVLSDPCVTDILPPKVPIFESFKCDVGEEVVKKLSAEVNMLSQKVQELTKENTELKTENKDLKEKYRVLSKKLSQYHPRRVNQMLKRKTDSKEMWKKKFQVLSRTSKKAVEVKKKT